MFDFSKLRNRMKEQEALTPEQRELKEINSSLERRKKEIKTFVTLRAVPEHEWSDDRTMRMSMRVPEFRNEMTGERTIHFRIPLTVENENTRPIRLTFKCSEIMKDKSEIFFAHDLETALRTTGIEIGGYFRPGFKNEDGSVKAWEFVGLIADPDKVSIDLKAYGMAGRKGEEIPTNVERIPNPIEVKPHGAGEGTSSAYMIRRLIAYSYPDGDPPQTFKHLMTQSYLMTPDEARNVHDWNFTEVTTNSFLRDAFAHGLLAYTNPASARKDGQDALISMTSEGHKFIKSSRLNPITAAEHDTLQKETLERIRTINEMPASPVVITEAVFHERIEQKKFTEIRFWLDTSEKKGIPAEISKSPEMGILKESILNFVQGDDLRVRYHKAKPLEINPQFPRPGKTFGKDDLLSADPEKGTMDTRSIQTLTEGLSRVRIVSENPESELRGTALALKVYDPSRFREASAIKAWQNMKNRRVEDYDR